MEPTTLPGHVSTFEVGLSYDNYPVCLRCGSSELRMPAASRDAFIPGVEDVTGSLVCERCGIKGMPLLFDVAADAGKYRGAREEEGWEEAAGAQDRGAAETEAAPSGYLVPATLFGAGLILCSAGLVLGLAVLVSGSFAGHLALLVPFAFGLPVALVGLRQIRALHRSRAHPTAATS